MRSELEVVVGLNLLKISRIEVEMKKFRLISNSFLKEDGQLHSRQQFVEANSLADVIEYIESNAGWYTDINVAFKVAYIKEVEN